MKNERQSNAQRGQVSELWWISVIILRSSFITHMLASPSTPRPGRYWDYRLWGSIIYCWPLPYQNIDITINISFLLRGLRAGLLR